MNLGRVVHPRPILVLSEMKSEVLQKNVTVRTVVFSCDMELLGRRNHVWVHAGEILIRIELRD